MAVNWTAVDWTDPCAALQVMRPGYYQLLAGAKNTSVRYGDTEVRFADSEVKALAAVIAELEAKCKAKQTGQPARYAIAAGYRR